MVHGLELETAVEPVQPLGAVDVHGGAHLAGREGLFGAEVGSWHTPVGEGDLHVQHHGADVRDEDVADDGWPVGEVAPAQEVAEDVPVAAHECDFERAGPPCGAELGGAGGEEMGPG